MRPARRAMIVGDMARRMIHQVLQELAPRTETVHRAASPTDVVTGLLHARIVCAVTKMFAPLNEPMVRVGSPTVM